MTTRKPNVEMEALKTTMIGQWANSTIHTNVLDKMAFLMMRIERSRKSIYYPLPPRR